MASVGEYFRNDRKDPKSLVSLRLRDSLVKEIADLCHEEGLYLTMSQALRLMIERGIEASRKGGETHE